VRVAYLGGKTPRNIQKGIWNEKERQAKIFSQEGGPYEKEKRFVGMVGICIGIVGLNPFTTFAASPASEPFKIGFICSITGS
jgi:hypothetical protein